MRHPQTHAEKLLSTKAGRSVRPGEYVLLPVDVALANDITAPVAIEAFQRHGGENVHDPERIILIPDHFTPNKDIASAEQAKTMRLFAESQNIPHYFEVGRMGIEHVMLPEEGLVKSGDLIIGADSHTCTYGALGAFATGVGSTDVAGVFLTGLAWFRVPSSIRVTLTGSLSYPVSAKDVILSLIAKLGVDGANYQVLEFTGPGVTTISMEGRLCIANMAIEAGAKTGLFPVDGKTQQYALERGATVSLCCGDPDAAYTRDIEIHLSDLEPMVAYPSLPSNGKTAREAEADHIEIQQVVIGSCTNGRIEDLRAAAGIFKDRSVHSRLRCIVIPGSQRVYKQAIDEGLVGIFIDAGCVVSTPTCGPCLGGHMGILASGERAVSTTNRNFVGRMGHLTSEVFLASPAVAAASAVMGKIAHPNSVGEHVHRQKKGEK